MSPSIEDGPYGIIWLESGESFTVDRKNFDKLVKLTETVQTTLVVKVQEFTTLSGHAGWIDPMRIVGGIWTTPETRAQEEKIKKPKKD